MAKGHATRGTRLASKLGKATRNKKYYVKLVKGKNGANFKVQIFDLDSMEYDYTNPNRYQGYQDSGMIGEIVFSEDKAVSFGPIKRAIPSYRKILEDEGIEVTHRRG